MGRSHGAACGRGRLARTHSLRRLWGRPAMTRTTLSLGVAAALLALSASRSEAQNIRSYVSSTPAGVSCTFTTPCGSVQVAIQATMPGGEVYCLDPGQSASVEVIAINQSITIDCRGGSIGSVTVNGPGIFVKLRNLTINSFGFVGGGIGVDFQNGAALYLENCQVEGWNALPRSGPGIGVRVAPPDGVTARLHVSDSLIRDNGLTASGGGIIVQPAGSGSARVVIERTRVEFNTFGIFANGTGSTGVISVQVRDSVVANNTFSGISSFTSPGHSTVATGVDHSASLLNGANGILAQGAGGFVFLKGSTVMSNVTGLNAVSGGAIFSYQDNALTGNVTDGAPTNVLTVK